MRTFLTLIIGLVPTVVLAQTPLAGDWLLTEEHLWQTRCISG
jgi:hypothetical protein